MKQVECIRIGAEPWNNVVVVEREPPAVGPGQVRVAVRARPIDPADLLLLEGRHLFRPALPAVVGIEGAGVIVEAAPDAGLAVGTPVAIPSGGTWREEMVVRAESLIPLPPGTDLQAASMLPVNPFTAAGLLDGVAAGAWVVQNAGTSAVARIVTRLANKRGIRTVSVVRSEARSEELLAAGADAVLVDGAELASRVREVTGGAPVVRALDAVAAEAAGRLFECVSEGGELVCYGLLEGDRVHLPAAQLVFRDVRVRGFSRLRSFSAMELAHRRAIEAELLELFAAGVLESEIEATYPLEEVAAALQHQLRPGRRGKIVLVS